MDKGGFKCHACCWTWAPAHLSMSKEKSVYCRKEYFLLHEAAGPAEREEAIHKSEHTWGSHIPRPISHRLISQHLTYNILFKCVFFSDVHILHLLMLMRVWRNSWEQRENWSPRGTHWLLVTAIVRAAWTPEKEIKHTCTSLEHCHSEVWLICILIRAAEKASKGL